MHPSIHRVCLFAVLCTGWMTHRCPVASAQLGFPGAEPAGQYPAAAYYSGLQLYRDGDTVAALEFFDAALTQGRKTIEGRWLDSVPALAMRAECLYQLGDCVGSLESIEALTAIAKANARWPSRVVWSTVFNPGVVRQNPSYLWPSAAPINVMSLSRKVQFEAGVNVTANVLARGGTIEPFNVKVLDVVELMRCIATAMHRRRVLLGPLSTDDPSVVGLLDTIKYPARLTAADARGLIGSMRGCGYFAAGNDDKTVAAVQSTSIGGRVHALSPVALLSAVRVAATDDDVSTKIAGAIRAADVAAAVGQTEWIGPALQIAAGMVQADTAGELATYASGVATAMVRPSRLASLHAAVAAADAYVTAGQYDSAAGMLQSASQIASRRDVYAPRIDAYAAYVQTRLTAATSSGANGGSPAADASSPKSDPAMTAEMLDPATAASLDSIRQFAVGNLPTVRRRGNRGGNRRGGPQVTLPRVLQKLQLPTFLSAAGTSSSADTLASIYVRDPPQWLWRTDPVDALGSAHYDNTPIHRVRLSLAIASGNPEKILLAMDDYAIDRFLGSLPIGGRAASVRHLSWTPAESLSQPARKFLDANPAMKSLREDALQSGPDPAAAPTLRAAANRIAVSRNHIPWSALPSLPREKPASALPAETAVLAAVQIDNAYQFIAWSRGRLRQWRMPAAPIQNAMKKYMSSIAVTGGATRLSDDPDRAAVRQRASIRLRQTMFPDDDFWRSITESELCFVPDGLLWYLPLETLVITDESSIADGTAASVGDRLTVRYSVSVGSVTTPPTNVEAATKIALAGDLFFAPRDVDANRQILMDLAALPNVDIEIPRATPTNRIGSSAGHVVVAAIRTPIDHSSAWTISPTDPPRTGSTIASMLSYPHDPPSSIFMPGYSASHSRGGNGSEIFRTLATLRAAGVRDVVLSRWPVGGQSSAIICEQYLQEVAAIGPAAALQRARTILRQSELNPADEPLLAKSQSDREDITGDEPLFWATYLHAR